MTVTTPKAPAMNDQPTGPPRVLADLRRAAGLSQAQLGERMGVHADRVGTIEGSYPNLRFDTLYRYIQAVGGGIQFIVGTTHVFADQMIADPRREATRAYLKERRGMGNLVYVPSAKKLPLKGDAAQPGRDDPGRNENHPDTESDQSDSGQRQQP